MEKRRGGDGDNRRGDEKKKIDEMEKNRRDGKK